MSNDDFDPANPVSGLGEHHHGNSFAAGMCDGAAHRLNCGQEDSQKFTKDAGDAVSVGY